MSALRLQVVTYESPVNRDSSQSGIDFGHLDFKLISRFDVVDYRQW